MFKRAIISYNYLLSWLAKTFPCFYRYLYYHRNFVKFLIAGGIATAVNLVFLFIFHELFAWAIVLSASLSFIFAFLVSFNLQKFWTFRDISKKRIHHQLIFYFILAFLTLNLNALGMYYLVEQWEIWYLLAQIIVSFILGLLNFFTFKLLVFNRKNED